jgi:hypothetical protein
MNAESLAAFPAALRMYAGAAKPVSHFLKRVAGFAGTETGGARRDRTDDLLLAKQALSQLSYGPFRTKMSGWWAWVDLNYRPHAYQACALTT